jgi:hypothetical protein
MVLLHVWHFLLRDFLTTMKCERSAGVDNQWSRCRHLTQPFKLYPEIAKKSERTCVLFLYVGTYYIYMARRICKCIEVVLYSVTIRHTIFIGWRLMWSTEFEPHIIIIYNFAQFFWGLQGYNLKGWVRCLHRDHWLSTLASVAVESSWQQWNITRSNELRLRFEREKNVKLGLDLSNSQPDSTRSAEFSTCLSAQAS